jgi:hypothetical protein
MLRKVMISKINNQMNCRLIVTKCTSKRVNQTISLATEDRALYSAEDLEIVHCFFAFHQDTKSSQKKKRKNQWWIFCFSHNCPNQHVHMLRESEICWHEIISLDLGQISDIVKNGEK